MIICYTVLEIWCVTNVIVIFHFGLLLAFLPSPPNSPKNENFNKMKKMPGYVIILHRCTKKIMVICYTVPEILHMTHVIVIFYFGLFFALLQPKKSNFAKEKNKKTKKNQKENKNSGDIIILHLCTKNFD